MTIIGNYGRGPLDPSTPIPEEWTINAHPNLRELRPGMIIRFPLAGEDSIFRIDSTNRACAKAVEVGSGRKMSISLLSEVEYCNGLAPELRDVLDWSGSPQSITNGGQTMSTEAVSAAPTATKGKKRKKRTKEPKQQLPCVCGCGGTTGGYFCPGHDARFKSWLKQIERGEKKPVEVIKDASLRKKLGPWKKKGDGLVPTNTYKDIAR